MTKWLKAEPKFRIEHEIKEAPLLHACSGQDTLFGDKTIDIDPRMNPDVIADITRKIPYPDDSFAAAFADFPWTAAFKRKVSKAMKELLRVAPIVYTISPWTYGSSKCKLEWVKVLWQPGVNQALLFSKYIRNESETCNRTDCNFNANGKYCKTIPELSKGNACKTFRFHYSYVLVNKSA